jgi:hypothetical protein
LAHVILGLWAHSSDEAKMAEPYTAKIVIG